MDPQLSDFYNDEPHGVKVIEKLNEEYEKLNEEYETAQDRIEYLEQQLKNEKLKTQCMNAFIDPPCFADDEADLETFHDKIRGKLVEWCGDDLSEQERLSYKLLEDYNAYRNSSKEDSLIQYIIVTLNECTQYQNFKWCELFVLSTLEAYGITTAYTYWEPPMFEVENLLTTLSDCDFTLVSLTPFEC